MSSHYTWQLVDPHCLFPCLSLADSDGLPTYMFSLALLRQEYKKLLKSLGPLVSLQSGKL